MLKPELTPDQIADQFIYRLKNWKQFSWDSKPEQEAKPRYLRCRECTLTWSAYCPCCGSRNWKATKIKEEDF